MSIRTPTLRERTRAPLLAELQRSPHLPRVRACGGMPRIDVKPTFNDVVRFVENEPKCCPFLSFAIELAPGSGPIWLRLTGGSS